jgi:hypothetical protein
VYVVNGKHPTEVQPLLPQLAEETAPSGIACRVNINLNLTPGTTDEELEALVQKVKTAISLLIKRAD